MSKAPTNHQQARHTHSLPLQKTNIRKTNNQSTEAMTRYKALGIVMYHGYGQNWDSRIGSRPNTANANIAGQTPSYGRATYSHRTPSAAHVDAQTPVAKEPSSMQRKHVSTTTRPIRGNKIKGMKSRSRRKNITRRGNQDQSKDSKRPRK